MDTYKIKWTLVGQKIYVLLCMHVGEQLSQREIAIKLNVSPTAVANAIKELEEYITIKKTKTINFIELNRDNQRTINMKRIENIKQLYLSGLSEYLIKELFGSTIIVFGSYSRGEDTIKSDIDIAIIERRKKDINVEKFEKELNRKINILFYNSWKEINHNLKNNILNGIILHGSVNL